MLIPGLLSAQVSPGPLSQAHADLEGVLGCTNCHTVATRRPDFKCLTCHMEIRERLDNSKGYHAKVVERGNGERDCVRCHAEHAGREFKLIRWPTERDRFDHTQTGFTLQGKHGTVACTQCHNADRVRRARQSSIVVKDLDRTYMGLDQACLSCHADPHRSELGQQCTSCHSQDAWRPIRSFNHSTTRFSLTGAHARVSCNGCHTPAPGSTIPASFKKDNFNDCASCHKDAHSGGFKAACSTCHSTANWRVTKTAVSAQFDHSKTKYPLLGKHNGLACTACHKTADFGAPLKSAKCTDCHTDKHKAQFLTRPDRGDCVGCHTVDGFKPATFDVSKHAGTQYPLAGKHAAVACVKCHEGRAENTNYHPPFGKCIDCHNDDHAGEFQARFQNKCESCHTVSGFLPATFTLSRHRDSRFPLTGAHLATACVDCHKPLPQRTAKTAHRYVFSDLAACTSCHTDPHESAAGKTGCETCHNVQSWKTIATFDHASTQFPLRGTHQIVSCLKCHKPDEPVSQMPRRIRFRTAPTNCAGCHDDIHSGQFRNRPGGLDCATCHNVANWLPSLFDHRQTGFPLDGAHRGVACAGCHKTSSGDSNRARLIYAVAPKECAACH